MDKDFQLHYWIERVAVFDDQFAYEKLYFHFSDGLFSLAHSFVHDKQVAEEIVSDAFINIWRNRARLLQIQNLQVYLFVSVKNLSIKHLTRTKKEGVFGYDQLLLQNISGTSLSPEQLMVSKELLSQIARAIDALPAKCKLIFRLAREEGMKYKEISEVLNISVKTIDAQMAIAARKICQSLNFVLKK